MKNTEIWEGNARITLRHKQPLENISLKVFHMTSQKREYKNPLSLNVKLNCCNPMDCFRYNICHFHSAVIISLLLFIKKLQQEPWKHILVHVCESEDQASWATLPSSLTNVTMCLNISYCLATYPEIHTHFHSYFIHPKLISIKNLYKRRRARHNPSIEWQLSNSLSSKTRLL